MGFGRFFILYAHHHYDRLKQGGNHCNLVSVRHHVRHGARGKRSRPYAAGPHFVPDELRHSPRPEDRCGIRASMDGLTACLQLYPDAPLAEHGKASIRTNRLNPTAFQYRPPPYAAWPAAQCIRQSGKYWRLTPHRHGRFLHHRPDDRDCRHHRRQ